MKKRRLFISVMFLFYGVLSPGQTNRVFLPYPETVGIYEFNTLSEGVLANDTTIQDLSGNGLDGTVLDNDTGVLSVGPGDSLFGDENLEVGKINFNGRDARIVVKDDGDAFEMDEAQDFSVEMYVHHEDLGFDPNFGDWGVLLGTWSSRVPLNGVDDDADSLWYGWGLIRFHSPVEDPPGWRWICSPVNSDGTTSPGMNEVFSDQNFEIPEGYHYVAVSCDRNEQMMRVYLDAIEVSTTALQANWSFETPLKPPENLELATHARFTMMNGENFPGHPNPNKVTMPPPAGFQLDAVRVSKRALSKVDIEAAWEEIQTGTPTPSSEIAGIIKANATNLVPGQCLSLDASDSLAGPGRTIEKYEWKIGDGDFEEGDAVFETSFAEELPEGLAISLRITNNAAEISTTQILIKVATPSIEGSIKVSVNGEEVKETIVSAVAGSEILIVPDLSINWPEHAFECPISGGVEIPAPTITSYSWDFNGDGTEDSTDAAPEAWIATETIDSAISLKVTNSIGQTATFTRPLKIVDNMGNSQVFHTTDDTILNLEFNDLELASPIASDGTTTTEDLSDNGFQMAFYDVMDALGAFDHFSAIPGPAQFSDDDIAVTYSLGEDGARLYGPRGIIEVDDDAFEMDSEQSFTFEIYVKPGGEDPAWSSLAGTFRARTTGQESDPRYGWGIMKTAENQQWTWQFGIGAPGTEGGEQWAGTFIMPPGVYTYFACVVDRESDPQEARLYVNGERVTQLSLDPSWSFETPAGSPHTKFCIFTRENLPGAFPANVGQGTTIDGLRLQSIAITDAKIMENWEGILSGLGADYEASTGGKFVRGQVNSDQNINLADAIFVLSYLFASGETPACLDAADTNDDGSINLADAIKILGYLFAGDDNLPAPFPECGPDVAPDDLPECVSATCN